MDEAQSAINRRDYLPFGGRDDAAAAPKLAETPEAPELCAVRVVVTCLSGDAEPDLYFVVVVVTSDDVDEGLHYAGAKYAAESEGYEEAGLAYDEHDYAGEALMQLFEWGTASWVNKEGRPVSERPRLDYLGRYRRWPLYEDIHEDHAVYDRTDWRAEVASHDTQLGYWDWVEHQLQAADIDAEAEASKRLPAVLEMGPVVLNPDLDLTRLNFGPALPAEEPNDTP